MPPRLAECLCHCCCGCRTLPPPSSPETHTWLHMESRQGAGWHRWQLITCNWLERVGHWGWMIYRQPWSRGSSSVSVQTSRLISGGAGLFSGTIFTVTCCQLEWGLQSFCPPPSLGPLLPAAYLFFSHRWQPIKIAESLVRKSCQANANHRETFLRSYKKIVL